MAKKGSIGLRRTRKQKKKGRGLMDRLIDKLPVELHIPGYKYCGPGTKLAKRLARNDKPINKTDELCQKHDKLYAEFKDSATRNQADKELASATLKRASAKDASVGEKLAALGIAGVMTAKRKLGMGLKKTKHKRKTGGVLKASSKLKSSKKKKRIIPIPKKGGFLPLLFPILGALGALGGGAAGIAKAVNDAKANKEQLEEQKRHNLALESAAKGRGLYLKPYKGYGMFLKYPFPKN